MNAGCLALLFAVTLTGFASSFAEDKPAPKPNQVKALISVAGDASPVVIVETLDKLQMQAEVVTIETAAGGQAIVVRRPGGRYTAGVREKVNPMDPTERFTILAPGGPLVVQVAIRVNGQPFRVEREKLLDEMLKAADKDKNGKTTWEEALKSNRFTLGRISTSNQQYAKRFDTNEDNIVDRGEARAFVAQFFQGPAFMLSAGYGYRSSAGLVFTGGSYRGGQADVHRLLDVDKDGALSAKEIAAAPERLKSRDANGNDLLEVNEMTDRAARNNLQVFRNGARPTVSQLAMLLGPTAKAEPLFQAIQQRYKNDNGDVVAESFSAVPSLFTTLDKNEDGKIQADEVLALNDIKPHLELNLDLSKKKAGKGLSLKSLAPALTKAKESAKAISVTLPGAKLDVTANMQPARTYDYSQTAKTYLQRYDKDGNEYLDKKELPGNLARQFALWDADEDGKVFAKEITASYTRMMAPRSSQVRASATSQGNSMFQALDLSGDGRLSLREMRSVPEQLKKFDKDKDGQIRLNEVPISISVSFGLGTSAYISYRRPQQGARPGNQPPANNGAPPWFTRMDRNGDGDLTLKEFLGGKEQFQKLDTNKDGFIEPQEAKAADEGN